MTKREKVNKIVCPICNRVNEFFPADIDDDVTITCWCCRRKIDVRGVAYGEVQTA